jgi:uncharacterized protein GlcG (DUF336 family)
MEYSGAATGLASRKCSASAGRLRKEGSRRTAALAPGTSALARARKLAAQRQLEYVIALKCGVPIKVGDDTIGAVGVSGSTSGGDEACAMAGVAKVADQLK